MKVFERAIRAYQEEGMKALLKRGSAHLTRQIKNARGQSIYEDERHGAGSAPVYRASVIAAYPHDRNASTQGLAFENGTLFESTGKYGKSSLRRVDLKTGRVLQLHALPGHCFGEGITVLGDAIVQLTWQDRKGFVYDKHSFELRRTFTYQTEGWGITYDGKNLIMSDGTQVLHVLDVDTFKVVDHIQVSESGRPVGKLNDLQFINGMIFANIWHKKSLAIINLYDGQVTGWLDLSPIVPGGVIGKPAGVLNGIAYDSVQGRLLATGKRWPKLYVLGLPTLPSKEASG